MRDITNHPHYPKIGAVRVHDGYNGATALQAAHYDHNTGNVLFRKWCGKSWYRSGFNADSMSDAQTMLTVGRSDIIKFLPLAI